MKIIMKKKIKQNQKLMEMKGLYQRIQKLKLDLVIKLKQIKVKIQIQS